METITTGIGVLIAVLLLVLLGLLFAISRLFRKVEQGKALIVSKVKKVDVTFTGAVVLPVLHKAETMDISVKTMEITRTAHEGLICRDNIRADIRVTFFVRVNKTTEDVIKVAQAIGTERASDQSTLQELFNAKFSEALKTVGKHLDFEELYTERGQFRDRIIEFIGTDLNGYSLEDAAIDYLEQTPMAQLDAANILDAQGIRKITELTAAQNIRTNEHKRHEEKEIERQNVEAREAIYAQKRRDAENAANSKRDIETKNATTEAETEIVRADEQLRAHGARIRSEQELGVQRENRDREIAVAEKNRERVIAIETERIEKDRMLEVISRERETELSRISKDKELEAEKREIAEAIRERIAVDKTVAEQEENIKKLRVVEEAERQRQATIILAEGEAQEQLVKDIKAAEAAEQAATHKAREELTLAEARRQAAEMDAAASVRLAEGRQAEAAADGLAEVQVRERDAEALEKIGRAEATVNREKALAEAEEIEKVGRARAVADREKLRSEAEGITEKAEAMATLDAATREHEEYRLRLDAEKEIRLAGIDVQRQVAEAQAGVLGKGLESADIDIVGGDGMFFDRIVNSIGMGKAVDGFVAHSEVAQSLAGPWMNGSADLPADLSRLLGSVDTGDIKNLTVSALLLKLINAGGPNTDGLQDLLKSARRIGVADAPLSELDTRAVKR
ncbi:SPFH domain-containing protein [Nocardiopsis ansamitocini]|uniref:Band 7 domain-containing protein n=1 Tax=Nocardiopsis ansamitocini TaxID=1670832 RepID=A0A9W6UKK1_9ACTN|nr:SPFH domain-containing protein [Nocardiopsis ansamitocini]GLU50059.1 hypothetical protein Nans01_44100 [Nocardiopsis ansamitocini]